MCGPNSAIGLAEDERVLWPVLRERLREPGALMGLMRGLLGEDAEVGVVVSTTAAGLSQPVAILATPAIVEEIRLDTEDDGSGVRRGWIGDDEVRVIMGTIGGSVERPLAVAMTDWMRQHLYVYARQLWRRPDPRPDRPPDLPEH